MRSKILIAAALFCGTELACVESLRAGPFAPLRLNLAMATIGSLSASPATISFQANNPEAGIVSGSAPGNLTWMLLAGSQLENWTLSVQSGSSTFDGCPTIPISAVRVNCSNATVSGGGGTGGCGGSFLLSTTPQQIAAGTQGNGANSYSVLMNFTLDESWRYKANSTCTLTLTYSVSAP